jgi:hypothetical protein
MTLKVRVCLASAVVFAALAAVTDARGVASFARQTNLPCSSCHTMPPELTPLGRLFKLNGYTMTGIKQISSDRGPTKAGLNLNTWLPLSAFFQLSDTVTHQPQPGGHSVNEFLAGELCAIGVPEIRIVPTEVVSLGVVGNLDEAACVGRDRACQKKTHRLGELEITILCP